VEAVAVSWLTDGDWQLRWRCCGGRPVAVSWLNGDSQATVLLFQVAEKKKEAPALPFSSSSSSFSATFPFPFVPFRYGFSKPERFLCQCRFFLNCHGPLSFTSHCPSRYVFPVFFPLFFGLFSPLLSSVPSLFFSVFCFPPLFPLFACWRWGVFIGQKGAGASLLPPYGSAWGAGLAALPQRRVGWVVGVAGRARLPWCIIMRVCGVSGGGRHVACRVHWRKKKKLPSPVARPGEGERGTLSFKTTLFFLKKNMKWRRFIQNASFHLKVAPTFVSQISP